MFEKVNPSHPDKVADRIAGALVDYAYSQSERPRIAVEVLLGHGECFIITESSICIPLSVACEAVTRISNADMNVYLHSVTQDEHLAENQVTQIRCGDNGIFCGMPITQEQRELSEVARLLYSSFPCDGKYIINNGKIIACQSHADAASIKNVLPEKYRRGAKVNPLGYWTGGADVDSGATNRKLGSDMGDAVTGGGLHGKDLSKADVSVNIFAHLMAQETGLPVKMCCAIGDEQVNGVPYEEIVKTARNYIDKIGGFEKFAEWGLI